MAYRSAALWIGGCMTMKQWMSPCTGPQLKHLDFFQISKGPCNPTPFKKPRNTLAYDAMLTGRDCFSEQVPMSWISLSNSSMMNSMQDCPLQTPTQVPSPTLSSFQCGRICIPVCNIHITIYYCSVMYKYTVYFLSQQPLPSWDQISKPHKIQRKILGVHRGEP